MLRPNKRFLRHIIKDTDTHNKALLAREAADSKARLKDLEHAEDVRRKKMNPNVRDIRQRQMGNIHAILGGKTKRKPDKEQGISIKGTAQTEDRGSTSSRGDDILSRRRDDRRSHGRLGYEDDYSTSGEQSSRLGKDKATGRDSDSTPGTRFGRDTKAEPTHRRSTTTGKRTERARSRERSRSPRRRSRRSCSPDSRRRRPRQRSPLPASRRGDGSASDDDLIGPAPPPRFRGRGKQGGSADLDRRFSESYDPKADVHAEEDEPPQGSSWDDDVEAYRDRQKLRANQEERLRAAGFSTDQLQRANAADEEKVGKSEEDVRWAKAGERREWDQGKE